MYRCVARTPPAAGIRPSVGPVAASGSQSLQWHAPSYASPWGQSPTAKCSSLASYNASQPYGLQPPHPKGSLELTCHQTQMLGVSFSWERSGRDVSSSETITGFPAAMGCYTTWACGNGQWWVEAAKPGWYWACFSHPCSLFELHFGCVCELLSIRFTQSLSVQRSEASLKKGKQIVYFLNVKIFIIEEGI